MKRILINLAVLVSILAYLIRLSFDLGNEGFFWRAMAFSVVFTILVAVTTYKSLEANKQTMGYITGVLCVFMFLFVISATIPIDGISCLSFGKPLINPASCGGGVNYHSLWTGMFGSPGQLGFYQKTTDAGVVFDWTTLILNLGWIVFPLGVLANLIVEQVKAKNG